MSRNGRTIHAADLAVEATPDGRLRIYDVSTDPPTPLPGASVAHTIGGDTWRAVGAAVASDGSAAKSDRDSLYWTTKDGAARALAAAKEAVSK